jgi:hypothetical protein
MIMFKWVHTIDVLTVAGLPALVAFLVWLAFLLLLSSFFAVADLLAVANISADPGVPILAGVFSYRVTVCVYCTMRHSRLSDFRTIGLPD